jgi:hypothetical protein
VPDEIHRLADDLADDVVGVVIAVRTGENNNAEFHGRAAFGLKGCELVSSCTTRTWLLSRQGRAEPEAVHSPISVRVCEALKKQKGQEEQKGAKTF